MCSDSKAIEVKISARDTLYHGIFTTALEGGIGYWAECELYRWSYLHGQADVNNFYAEVIDVEDEDAGEYGVRYRIDRSVIAKGYGLATTDWRYRLAWSTTAPPLVVTDNTDWDYDASDADMIVQLGLFEDVRYG